MFAKLMQDLLAVRDLLASEIDHAHTIHGFDLRNVGVEAERFLVLCDALIGRYEAKEKLRYAEVEAQVSKGTGILTALASIQTGFISNSPNFFERKLEESEKSPWGKFVPKEKRTAFEGSFASLRAAIASGEAPVAELRQAYNSLQAQYVSMRDAAISRLNKVTAAQDRSVKADKNREQTLAKLRRQFGEMAMPRS
jgi:hypothetical protein